MPRNGTLKTLWTRSLLMWRSRCWFSLLVVSFAPNHQTWMWCCWCGQGCSHGCKGSRSRCLALWTAWPEAAGWGHARAYSIELFCNGVLCNLFFWYANWWGSRTGGGLGIIWACTSSIKFTPVHGCECQGQQSLHGWHPTGWDTGLVENPALHRHVKVHHPVYQASSGSSDFILQLRGFLFFFFFFSIC